VPAIVGFVAEEALLAGAAGAVRAVVGVGQLCGDPVGSCEQTSAADAVGAVRLEHAVVVAHGSSFLSTVALGKASSMTARTSSTVLGDEALRWSDGQTLSRGPIGGYLTI
jgi:hypothetical protein